MNDKLLALLRNLTCSVTVVKFTVRPLSDAGYPPEGAFYRRANIRKKRRERAYNGYSMQCCGFRVIAVNPAHSLTDR
jgi:hypothetical protein